MRAPNFVGWLRCDNVCIRIIDRTTIIIAVFESRENAIFIGGCCVFEQWSGAEIFTRENRVSLHFIYSISIRDKEKAENGKLLLHALYIKHAKFHVILPLPKSVP